MKRLLALCFVMLFLTACGKQEGMPPAVAVPTTETVAVSESVPVPLQQETTEPPETAEATEPLPPPSLELTEQGKAFLARLCSCIGYWEKPEGEPDSRSNETGFRTDIQRVLRALAQDARKLTKTKVMTLAGEAELQDGNVLFPWDMVEDFVMLAFGEEMPSSQYWKPDNLKGGVFYVPMNMNTERWQFVYSLFREWKATWTEVSGREHGQVIFDYYYDDPNVPTGNATFEIAAANNEHGFVVQSLKTEISPQEKVIQEAAEAYAIAFAEKVIAGDQEAIQAEMLEYHQRHTETYEEAMLRLAEQYDWEFQEREGDQEAAEIVDATASGSFLHPFRYEPLVDVCVKLDGGINHNLHQSLIRIVLAQTSHGYKVREYGFIY